MLDCVSGSWAFDLLNKLQISTTMLAEVFPAGSKVGTLLPALAETTGLSTDVAVITPGSHDTASAVAAVPCVDADVCFLSSGTWSLLGCELDRYETGPEAAAANFTNELGVGGKIRFLKNIAGLWLVQECRRHWLSQGDEYDYATLTEMAANSPSFRTLVNPDWEAFQSPGRMPEKIAEFAQRTAQPVPDSPGAFVRCALESLALAYDRTLRMLETITKKHFQTIHIVGGGCKNQLLNQLTANCTARRVVAGPSEATALGNGLVQAMTCGEIDDLSHLRRVVRDGSPELQIIEPNQTVPPDVFDRFHTL
ncbi:MAG: FGGY-family carbohydrate kinase [Pirellulaceae bacterium]